MGKHSDGNSKAYKEKSVFISNGIEENIKPLEEVGDSDPKCMVVFSWVIIIVGLLMLSGVAFIISQILLEWCLDTEKDIPGFKQKSIDQSKCHCNCE